MVAQPERPHGANRLIAAAFTGFESTANSFGAP